MRVSILILCWVAVSNILCSQERRLLFETNYGSFKVLLYDETPSHRDLLIKSIGDSTYHHSLFNRVIKNFVIQGGEHDVDIAKREAKDPLGKKPRLAAEFHPRAFHKIGVLGQGRDDNIEKASFLNQIYFVVGKKVTEEELNNLEIKKGRKFTEEQRKEYLKRGGLPRLDGDYTVFGEVYEGMDVLMHISAVATDTKDYPIVPIPFKISILQ